MDTLVTVIIPFYGVEKYIAACAESLMRQTWEATQFIFVNDGTRDRSREVLSEVLACYPGRNTRIVDQENTGLPRARAAGMPYAAGKYIMHVDSDDWVEEDAVERLVRFAEEKDADLVFCDFWKEYGSHRKLDRERDYTAADKLTYMRRLYRDGAYGYLWNKFARKSLYEGIFVPQYTMHEDIVVATQLLHRAGTIVHLPVPLIHYRRNNPTASTREATKRRRGQYARNYLDLFEAYRDCLPGSPVEPVLDDLILRAAWVGYSLDRALFDERPYLKEMARKLPLMPFHRVTIAGQLILKAFLCR